jgi:hypothetical protein
MGRTMLPRSLDQFLGQSAIERGAAAIYEFDEDLTENHAKIAGTLLSTPRLSWKDLCETNPIVADGYRGRARVALHAAIGAELG